MKAIHSIRFILAIFIATNAFIPQAAPLRVDVSRNTGRSDTAAPHRIEWQFDPAQPARTFGDVTVRFRNATPADSKLRSDWYKFGIDHGALVACDGVYVDPSGALGMIISGLAPGPHTIATFHNSLWRPEQTIAPFDAFLNGELALSGIEPTIQVTNDYDIASAYFKFTATAGDDVILQFKPVSGSGAERETIIINGFEIGASDPAERASKPVPFHGDEHANADDGAATLEWEPGASAVSHHLYFGETEEAVGAASPGSPEFQGNLSATLWTTPELDPHLTCFWRVDEITSESAVTKGNVWMFRPRRVAFPGADYYVKGNVMEGHCIDGASIDCGVTEPEPYENFLSRFPFFESHVETQSAREAYKRVLSDAGATQPTLDDHDTRVIQETLDGDFTFRGGKTGLPGLPDSQTDVGSWEEYPEERRGEDWDSDHDGLPDWWERIHQTDPSSEPGDFSDSNSDPDGNGFALLEEYLHWMAEPRIKCIENKAIEIDLSQFTRGFTNQPVHSIISAENGAAELAPGAAITTFRPAQNFTGLARFEFQVADAEGSSMTRSVGIHAHSTDPDPKLEVNRRGNELELEFQNPAEAEFQIQTSTRLRDWQPWTNLNESLTTLPLGVPALNARQFFRAQPIVP